MSKSTKLTAVEFLDSHLSAWWCRDGDIHCYLKKSLRPGELLLINIKNVRRQTNCFKRKTYRCTGKFRMFMDRLEHEAHQRGYTSLRVEGIMNEFLPEVLERRGYYFVSTDGCTSIYAVQLGVRGYGTDKPVQHFSRKEERGTPRAEVSPTRD